jgi:hypothetical protein
VLIGYIMADLEDHFFKQNVPGRWSSHEPRNDIRKDEYNDDVVPDIDDNQTPQTEEEALFEQAKQLSQADVPEPIRRSILAERMKKSKTGVKGVLADYKAHKAMERAAQEAKVAFQDSVFKRIAEGYKLSPEEALLIQQQKDAQKNANKQRDESDDDDGSDEDDDDDEEFMKEFREKRLQEMMAKASQPVFSGCKDVDTNDFIEEVDQADPRTIVVVHLYEPSVQFCIRMNRFLEEISRSMPKIKFLRMKASQNEIEVDRMTLPILNIYRAGEVVSVLAGIAAELGDFFTKEDVEWLLESTLHSHGLN